MPNGTVQKIAVIGASIKGCQVAAMFANAGFPVLLMDQESGLAAASLKAMEAERLFTQTKSKTLITPLNLPADFERIKEVDWIIESVTEKLDVKAALYREIEARRKHESIISTTSALYPFSLLVEEQDPRFARNFLVTHFATPVLERSLVQITHGINTPPELLFFVRNFCDHVLGRTALITKDTPGLITDRINLFLYQIALNAVIDTGLSIPEADAAFSGPMKLPHGGIFAQMDESGIDTIKNATRILAHSVETSDNFAMLHDTPSIIPKMIMDGYTGNRGKGGFYRISPSYEREALDMRSGRYVAVNHNVVSEIQKIKNLRHLCESSDKLGQFCWRVLSQTLLYVSELIPEISNDILAVDEAIREGLGWEWGPFELIDKMGADWFIARLRLDGHDIPPLLKVVTGRSFYQEQQGYLYYLTYDGTYVPVPVKKDILSLASIKRLNDPLYENMSARLWNIGDGVLCIEMTHPVNAIDIDIFKMIKRAVTFTQKENVVGEMKWKGLVLYSDGKHFSTGADLTRLLTWAQNENVSDIQAFIQEGKEALQLLRYAPFPSVAAVSGMTIGGGCEIALHASAIQAHTQTRMGLVETTIGLIPALGGCLQMWGRLNAAYKASGGKIPPVNQAFNQIMKAQISQSAEEAMLLSYMAPTDRITMNRARLLFDAKQRVLEMVDTYKAPSPWPLSWSGAPGRSSLKIEIEAMKFTNEADLSVADELVNVLCGGLLTKPGAIDEKAFLSAETRAFLSLFAKRETAEKIRRKLMAIKKVA